MRAPHRETSLRATPELIALYKRRARRLRSEICRDIWRAVWLSLAGGEVPSYADAPFAFGRRRCSSSRGMISTKLQGRVR